VLQPHVAKKLACTYVTVWVFIGLAVVVLMEKLFQD
jgi:hypothetical protein